MPPKLCLLFEEGKKFVYLCVCVVFKTGLALDLVANISFGVSFCGLTNQVPSPLSSFLSPPLSLSFLSLPYSFSLPVFSNLIAAALWPHCGSLFDKKNPLSLAITSPVPSLPFHSLLTPNTLLCGPSLPHSLTHFHIHMFIRCPLIGLNHTTALCVFQLYVAAISQRET